MLTDRHDPSIHGPKKSETAVDGWLLVPNDARFRCCPHERDFRDIIVRYGSFTFTEFR